MVYLINFFFMFRKRIFKDRCSLAPQRCNYELLSTKLRDQLSFESLLVEKHNSPRSSCPSVRYVNDVYLLLNQRRLDKMSLAALTEYFDRQPQTSRLNQIRSRMSDKQLHMFVKSRYIQSMSELQSWYEYLDQNASQLVDEAVSLTKIKEQQSPSPAPAPASD